MSRTIEIRPANLTDLDVARSWLSDAGLPIADLTPEHMQNFLVATVGNSPVGMIGLEQFGVVGLLRSLIVDPTARSDGIGGRLVDALESKASELGVTELWLLTIDADAYFSRLHYVVMARSEAPDVIRNTTEFSTLCPGDAALMRKFL